MAPPVMRLTSAGRFSWPITTWAAPLALASSALAAVETTPITVAPRCLAHWHMIRPTPPAAACTRMVCPGSTRWVRRSRYCAVRPCSIIAAPVMKSIASGSATNRSAAMIRWVA